MILNFHLSTEEFELVHKIALRSERSGFTDSADRMTLIMDLAATHLNGCPLHLAELAEAEGYDLAHDICGIRRHINRETGKLEDCFLPRYALQSCSA